MSTARGHAREIGARLLLTAVALVVAVALSDVALRLVGYSPTILDPDMFVANGDSLLPYRLQPNYRGRYAGAFVTIDTQGFRVMRPRLRPPATAIEKTVVLVGDSQIFGAGVGDDATIPAQLQDSIFARGRNVRIENVGVPGYSSWNEYRALEDYLATHRVDEVILLYHPSDATFENDFLRIGRRQFHTPIRRVVRLAYRYVYTVAFLRQAWLQLRAGHREPWSDTNVPSDSVVAYSLTAVQRAADLCRAKGVSFSVAFYRHVDALVSPGSWNAYESKLTHALSARHLPFFIVASHTSHLTPRQIMVSWADRHASARASAYIVTDFLRALKL